jgi:hypothetical protein
LAKKNILSTLPLYSGSFYEGDNKVQAGYHVFYLCIDRVWHRTTQVLDDAAFDEYMDMLDWKMPYNMAAFHFTSNRSPPVSNNPAYHAKPVIEVDLRELFEERKGVKLLRQGEPPVSVLRFGSGFVIIETNDSYYRLLKQSGKLLFEEYFPIPFAAARTFVNKYHRHASAPPSHKFSIGLLDAGRLVGVIIASTPKARALDDGFTLELNRCCVLPNQRNACSKLYAKAIKAGRNMGYRKFVTYTLTSEPGSSLKAVGFKLEGITQARPKGWDHPSRRRPMPERYPTGQKYRWVLLF